MLSIIGGIVVVIIIGGLICGFFSPDSSDNKSTNTSLTKNKQDLKCQICGLLLYQNQVNIVLFSNWYHYDCYALIMTIINIIKEENLKIEAINLIDRITKEKPTWEQLTSREKEIWNWLITRYINSEFYNKYLKSKKND